MNKVLVKWQDLAMARPETIENESLHLGLDGLMHYMCGRAIINGHETTIEPDGSKRATGLFVIDAECGISGTPVRWDTALLRYVPLA